MPRILLTGFCAIPGPDRSGVQMRYVLEALSRHYDVDALVIRHAEQAYVERRGDARILRVPLHDDDLPSRIEAFRRALHRQLEGAEYDVVHFRDGWAGVMVLEMREHFGYRTVFDLARSPSAEAPIMDLEIGNQLMQAEQRCLLGADIVLTPTETARAHLLKTRAQGVFLVPPGVNVDLFDWEDRPPGRPIILYAGSVKPGHGIRVLLRAMAYVVAEFDTHLVIVGAIEPKFRRALETAIDDLDLTGRVELRGEVEHKDMPEVIATSSICVAPAACESQSQPMTLYPTKLMEYMACRRAVVAPRRGTTNMLMRNATHGLMFTPGDPSDLARNLGVLLREPDLCARLAEAGYQHVRQYHTASAVRRALGHVYREILARAPADEDTGEHTGKYHVDEYTDRTPALLNDLHDGQDEITETSRVGSFQGEGFSEVSSEHASDIDEFGNAVEPRPSVEQSWSHGTDETAALPSDHDVTQDRENEEWIVPEWDEAGGWQSLADFSNDGTPLSGIDDDPFGDLDENSFVAGEINVNTRRPARDSNPPFTAVSVLLGSLSDDDAGRDKP